MMPRLEAAETLSAATAMALGSGSLKKGDAQRLKSRLARAARIGGGGRRAFGKADPATLAGVGIGVEVSAPADA